MRLDRTVPNWASGKGPAIDEHVLGDGDLSRVCRLAISKLSELAQQL